MMQLRAVEPKESFLHEETAMTDEQAGQVAIVTGGGRGIGRAIAQAFAAAGASVTVTARSEDQLAETVALIDAAGGRALAVPADVTDQAAVERVVKKTEARFGPVDVLVNNAGTAMIGPLWEADPQAWWRTVETNLRGTFLTIRAVLPSMVARRRGRIINLSGGGAETPAPEWSAYASSKAAILRLTDTLAAETADYGIQVFALGPGGVRTEMGEQAYAWAVATIRAGKYGLKPEHIPPARQPELAGTACVLIASGQADGLSGRHILAWQDLAYLVSRADEIRRQDLCALRVRR
jgi:NAD(P)-dependent dehydrogenase (short-subunit alcohol dehydrogenase family)